MLQSAQAVSASAKAKILIVEDEGLIARDLESRVRKAGYDVAGIVDSGEAALEKIQEAVPDLILMDIHLRGRMDGIETAKQVQQERDLPIIYLTAHTDRETLGRAKISGTFGYLAKPIGQASLPTSIEVALYKHRVERELRQQRAWLRTALRTMSDGVIVVDHFGRIQYMNPTAEALTQWSSAEGLNEPLSDVLKLFDPESGRLMDDVLAGGILDTNATPFPAGLKLLCRNDARVSVEGEIGPSTEDGAPLGAVITFRDVTLKEDEAQQRRQEQKMQAVGRLAAGVAHDFNNLLTVILGHASLLLSGEGQLDPRLKHALEEIKHAGTTAAAVTHQLLTFSRSQHTQPEHVDLTAVVQRNEELCRRSIGADILWKTALDTQLRPVYADAGQLAQVLINLVLNARDAMPHGGTLTVSTENIGIETPNDLGSEIEQYVALTVADTGIGMDPSVAEHIFEPFFTTKSPGQGTGLGLSIVHNIVNELGGVISVDSKPGMGSTFRVFLPVAKRASTKQPETVPATGRRAGSGTTILLADDNEPVRSLMQQYLESRGYHVLQAADGNQALALAAAHEGNIDILVTDVTMPGMSGFRLAQQLTQLRPELQTIFVSGYPGDVDEKSSRLAGARFLQKPLLHSELLAQIEAILGESASEVHSAGQ